jgi:TonB family protein
MNRTKLFISPAAASMLLISIIGLAAGQSLSAGGFVVVPVSGQTGVREPIRVGGNVQESKLIYRVEPVYPELAKRAMINGAVVMVATADEQGLVSDVRVTSGHPLLVEAAVAAVKQWRYSPTLLNGIPVPVLFTVTCIFKLMGDNDVLMAMDESGKLTARTATADLEMLMPKLVQGGTAFIQIATDTPVQVAERAVQDLMKRGVQNIQLSGPFTLYQGRVFYSGSPASPPQLMPDLEKLRALLDASLTQKDAGTVNILYYSIYVNQAGEIVAVQREAGPDNPEINQELMRSRVISPALMNGTPVPYVYTFRMGN